MKLTDIIKNSMRKKFRIVRNELVCPEAFHPLWYRIEQKHTLLFFFHWWSPPEFEPPHRFETDKEAIDTIYNKYPNAIIKL